MRLLRQPVFLAVALGHFLVDVLNGQTGVLLAVLSVPLGLSNADIGLIATGYSLLGSLTQPLFGWLADRHGARWATAGGVVWMAVCFCFVAVAPGAWAIGWMMLGALGSAAFHPPGTMKAAQAGRRFMAGQVATAASVFFLFGQGGLSVGPAIGGLILEQVGRWGLLALGLVTIPAGVWAGWVLREEGRRGTQGTRGTRGAEAYKGYKGNKGYEGYEGAEGYKGEEGQEGIQGTGGRRGARGDGAVDAPGAGVEEEARGPARLRAFGLVMSLASLRTAAQAILTTFAPKFFQDQGVSPAVYGAIVALYMGCSAVGGVLGGMLGDRWGRRRTIALTMAVSVAPFLLFPGAGGAWVFVWAGLAGLFNGAPHSILITLAQKALPGRAALASGLTLGLMFTAGTLGAYAGGLAADSVGLRLVLQSTAALAGAGALIAVLSRGREGL